MDNVITLDKERLDLFNTWDNLFDRKLDSEFLSYCIWSNSLNDKAHNLSHIFDVCLLAKQICQKIKLNDRDTLLVYMGALLHDIGCRYERKFHHVIGYGLTYRIIEDYCPAQFRDEEVLKIATAVLEHRSSNKQKPSSLISEIVSVADSGRPNFDKYIGRAVQFRLDNNYGEQELLEETHSHLIEKFGVEGYHWKSYPDIGMEFFKSEWEEFTTCLYDEEYSRKRIKDIFEILRNSDGKRNDDGIVTNRVNTANRN